MNHPKRFSKTVWLLVITLITQMFTVAGASAHMGLMSSKGMSSGNLSSASMPHTGSAHEMIKHLSAGQASTDQTLTGSAHTVAGANSDHANGCTSMSSGSGEDSNAWNSCVGQDDCQLQHCSAAHAIAKVFPASISPDLNQSWPRLSPRPLLLPLPPLGQPPKTA
ncbi:hypothetical protein CLV83_1066 [Marinobacterium mangrovicola]|uniref:Uncharacterized protein n=2 Tax=Marinobacterium mangrovicola TaxID=1476959 RepID=A0A4R1GNX2_9GAMM|nr:hypothetical protein CLV83_1066 [Marinobacterium mangrovicola]